MRKGRGIYQTYLHDNELSIYTSPTVSLFRRSHNDNTPAAFDTTMNQADCNDQYEDHQEGLQLQYGKERKEEGLGEGKVAMSSLPCKVPESFVSSPLSPSPMRERLSLPRMQQGQHNAQHTPLKRAPPTTLGSFSEHQYNISLKNDTSFQEDMLSVFRMRAQRGVLPDKPGALDDKRPDSNGRMAPLVDMTSLPSRVARGRSSRGVDVGVGNASLTRSYTARLIDTVFATPITPTVVTGCTGIAMSGSGISCATLVQSIEAEVYGRLIAEQLQVWLKEDVERRKVLLCEEHARHMLTSQTSLTMQVELSKRQHALRMRDLLSCLSEVSREECDTLLSSVRRLESEEAVLLGRVQRLERQVRWNQRRFAMQEQEVLSRIKLERQTMMEEMKLLEAQMEEALEKRKRVVLDAAFGRDHSPRFPSPAPQPPIFPQHTSCYPACSSKPPGQLPTTAVFDPTLTYRLATAFSMDVTPCEAPPPSSLRGGGGAFAVAIREAGSAARLHEEKLLHPFHHRVVDSPPADYYAFARKLKPGSELLYNRTMLSCAGSDVAKICEA